MICIDHILIVHHTIKFGTMNRTVMLGILWSFLLRQTLEIVEMKENIFAFVHPLAGNYSITNQIVDPSSKIKSLEKQIHDKVSQKNQLFNKFSQFKAEKLKNIKQEMTKKKAATQQTPTTPSMEKKEIAIGSKKIHSSFSPQANPNKDQKQQQIMFYNQENNLRLKQKFSYEVNKINDSSVLGSHEKDKKKQIPESIQVNREKNKMNDSRLKKDLSKLENLKIGDTTNEKTKTNLMRQQDHRNRQNAEQTKGLTGQGTKDIEKQNRQKKTDKSSKIDSEFENLVWMLFTSIFGLSIIFYLTNYTPISQERKDRLMENDDDEKKNLR